ncbi:MAG: hypothetical protein IT290_06115 [Deltaproteobacteria bacterium]|nr:hypothetical protein [Deltaproteobacteria bacterium]
MSFIGLLKYPSAFFIAFAVTLVLTPWIAGLAIRCGVVDRPSARRIHQQPIPRCGGLAIFIGFHAACAAIFLLPWPVHINGALDTTWWWNFLGLTTLIVLVGLADDIKGLRPLTKLVAQIAIAVLAFGADMRFGRLLGADLIPILDLAATVLWILLITNAFNLIDGLDGLATGLAIIAAFGIAGSFLFRSQPGDALVLLGFVGACAGFLRFNFHPASIFLGDTGSLLLGFTLATVSLSTAAKGTMLASLGVPLLAVGVPIFDSALAVWRRSMRRVLRSAAGEPTSGIMHFDMEHLHHRLMAPGRTQTRVAVWLYTANALLVAIGLASLLYSSHAVGIFLLAFVVGSYVVVRHIAHVELWDSGAVILSGLRKPSNRIVAVVLYPLSDFLILSLALAATLALSDQTTSMTHAKDLWLSISPIWCTPAFIMLFVVGAYSRVWSRARISEFIVLGAGIFAGVLVGLCLSSFILAPENQLQTSSLALFLLLSTVGLSGLRMVPRAVTDLMEHFGGASNTKELSPSRQILVYGAGARCVVYLHTLTASFVRDLTPVSVIGLLDDDPNLRKRFVQGHRVLGGIADLPEILSRQRVDQIVLTTKLAPETFESLLLLAERTSMTVVEWYARERVVFAPDGQTQARDAAAARANSPFVN